MYTTNTKTSLPIDPAKQEEQIYIQLFKFNTKKLKPGHKNHRFIVFFLACSVSFMVLLNNLPDGAGNVTIFSFFQALLRAIKEGKVSKAVARMLISRLERENIYVPEDVKEALREAVAG